MKILLAKENFCDVMGELPPLLYAHHREIEPENGTPLDFDFESYVNLERIGQCQIITARCNGNLVGYVLSVLGNHLHSKKTKFAHSNLFLLPDYRKGWNAIRLMCFADECFKSIGVDESYIGDHPGHDLSSLYKRLGYNCCERSFCKRLKEI